MNLRRCNSAARQVHTPTPARRFLFVIDLFLSGDQFEVFDNGVSPGDTSTPGGNIQCGAINTADEAIRRRKATGRLRVRSERGGLGARQIIVILS